jgi:hypothetical protein
MWLKKEIPKMAKKLGPKSILIREAITANPDKGNTELAAMLNDSYDRMDDKIKVTANDIAQQKQAMKTAGLLPAAAKKPGRKNGSPVHQPAAVKPAAAPRPAAHASPVDLIDSVFDLAQKCGGIEQLKRLVERLAQR